MAEKDISQKYLEEYADVFADIVNLLLPDGCKVSPEELYSGPTESIYKAENGVDVKEQRRDISKYFIRDNRIMALFGIENQSYFDRDMPVRVMGYDYSSYRTQIIKGGDRYPVITILLNFTNRKWDSSLSLKEILSCPEGLDGYVPDYRFKVINVAYISKKERDSLKSDFKIIADFFTEKREKGFYSPTDKKIEHEMAVLNMLRIFTNDRRYEEIGNLIKNRKDKGEVITMCTFIDEWENKGRIMEAVSIYSEEMHLDDKDILKKIMQKFGLESEEAKKYLAM